MQNERQDTANVKMIAYCGLDCSGCQIYLASKETNKEKKDEIAAGIIGYCKEHYSIEYSYDEVTNCDGCRSDTGRLFTGCSKCKIRNCATSRRLENCAHCGEYICENLTEFFKTDPAAKERLNEIKKSLS